MLRKKTFFAILLAIAVVCSCSYGPAEAANPFKRNIEVVVGFSAGGGSDICARMFSTIINDEKYLPVRLNVINKPGANSGVAINYVGGKQKDPHYLLFITPGFVSTPLQTNSPINYTKFTPIAIFGFDDWFFVVKEGGDYKTFEDLVKAAKANPGKIRFGGPGAGGITQICLAEMADTVGIDVAYVPFLGGADIMTAILGGHIEAGVLNVSEVSSFIEAKQLHALATPGEKRISRFSHVPTLTELGYNFTMAMPRGVVAAGDISKEAVDAYADAFKKMSEHPKWKQDYCEKYQFGANFKGPKEALALIEEMDRVFKVNMKKLGILK